VLTAHLSSCVMGYETVSGLGKSLPVSARILYKESSSFEAGGLFGS
jgi:hypothetical protein